MAERELIEYIRTLAAGASPSWLSVGIGDDAAVLQVPGGGRLVLTTDSVIEGVHFEEGTAPQLVGRKAVTRALSDLAAMAARPLCTVAAANFGRRYETSACEELSRALWQTAHEFSAPLIGGDVASGSGCLTVTVTALGSPGPGGVVARSGARPGDAVCVTGRLGGSIRGRHLRFRPRVEEALALAERFELHGMIDISDGLSTDALHVAEASGVGLLLRAGQIPISEDAAALAGQSGRQPLWHALNDGEDYELLFCLPAEGGRELAGTGVGGTEVSLIGEVIGGDESYVVTADAAREPLRPGGWEHLSR